MPMVMRKGDMHKKISLILGLMLLGGFTLVDFTGCSSDRLFEPRYTPIRQGDGPGSKH
jgi:hypothetical protein